MVNPLEGLETEHRAGVKHFVTGQHRAWRMKDEDGEAAMLVYVNVMGHAMVTLCGREGDGPWVMLADRMVTANGLASAEWSPPPADFAFSEKMLAALDAAQDADDLSGVHELGDPS